MTEYTDEEIDYVIDMLELGSIREQIKEDPEHIDLMMNTLHGTLALIRFRAWQTIKMAIRRLK